MHTRQDYLAGNCTHREFYGQYVNPYIKDYVKKTIGIKRLLKSTDKAHFNDIPLSKWDSMHIIRLSTKVGLPDNSLSFSICLHKEAARQILEEMG